MSPAAVSHTETTIDTNWAKRMDEEVFKTFRYCNISGNDISRNARKNRRPMATKTEKQFEMVKEGMQRQGKAPTDPSPV